MDDYLFQQHLHECETVYERTQYLEILNYADSRHNSCEQHALETDEFLNFVQRKGVFAPKTTGGASLVNGIRLVLQLNASNKDTFASHHISLPHESYATMVRTMRLPLRAIEGTCTVGPFFWSGFDDDDDDPHLQVICRKSDVLKKGKTRGWELMLSYSFKTAITTGYFKGTESATPHEAIDHLKASAADVAHPLLLPMIMFSRELSSDNDDRQRQARELLRKLENAIAGRDEVEDNELYVRDGILQLDQINRDLYECVCKVLWKRPQAYQENLREFEKALERLWERVEEDKKTKELERLQKSMRARLDFHGVKLNGIENYAWTSLERLRVQREALYNIIAQRESKLNLEIAKEQKQLAHAMKRDGTAMKTLSLLGAIFLPGTWLASVFSMDFFNFQSDDDHLNEHHRYVSPTIWVYFAFTIPITIIIVGSWIWFDRRRKANFKRIQADVDADIEKMEQDIMMMMRRKTMTQTGTWTLSPRKTAFSSLT